MSFFTTAVSTMSTLVVALGGGVGVSGKRQTSICILRMTFCSSTLRMNILPCASSFQDR